MGANGRCTERGFLEFHHIVPYAVGGEATVEAIALRCRAHNQYEAEQDFGSRQPLLVWECCGPWAYGNSVRTESAASHTAEEGARVEETRSRRRAFGAVAQDDEPEQRFSGLRSGSSERMRLLDVASS